MRLVEQADYFGDTFILKPRLYYSVDLVDVFHAVPVVREVGVSYQFFPADNFEQVISPLVGIDANHHVAIFGFVAVHRGEDRMPVATSW